MNANPPIPFDLVVFFHNLAEKIFFLPNPGNAGDSLIAAATFQFFEKHNIAYEIVTNNQFDSKGKIIVYGGGGNFGGINSRVAHFIKMHHLRAKKFILLPHTLFGAEQLLTELGSNVHLICREQVSYQHALTHTSGARVYLHNDMVINCDVNAILAQSVDVSISKHVIKEVFRRIRGINDYDYGISLRCVLHYWLYQTKQLFKPQTTSNILNAFRVDVEKTDIKIPEDNLDISDLFELSSCQVDLALLATQKFLTYINQFEVINTNRLHVAIAATLLGKQVNLYGNNYFKIKAIYEYSLLNRFSNVNWVE
jgi:exopolysaccharide biosynthesis predicted pyruvyltransferase EpsI